MEDGVSFARLDPASDERYVWLRSVLGVSTFGLSQLILRPGQRGRIHRHERQEEVYLVLDGTLTLIVEREEHRLGPYEIARVAPGVRRQLANTGDEPVLLLALGGATPHQGRDGVAYGSWEDGEGRPPQEVPLPPDLDR